MLTLGFTLHPMDEDLSMGTPALHPMDEDLSMGTPALHPMDEDLPMGTPTLGYFHVLPTGEAFTQRKNTLRG
jgi:hypothetical protein